MTIEHDVTNETHRANCSDCTALWVDLERISAEAAQLPPLAPSRDLWAGIEARLTSVPLSASTAPMSTAKSPWYASSAFRLAVAASLLVAVSSGVTWQFANRANSSPALGALPQASAEESALHLASFGESVTTMEREIALLQTIVRERRDELDPQTLTVLDENLAVIDRAITESRAALAADPASQFLSTQFTRAYASKLTLLRDIATLPVGI